MNSKITVSLKNLSNWIGKIYDEGKNRHGNFDQFVQEQDLKSALAFYYEMLAYVDEVKNELPQTTKLVQSFIENAEKLKEQVRYRGFFSQVLFDWTHRYWPGERMEKLMQVLRDIKDNVDNIIYQLEIN
ncbi:MAG: hypothetical protein QM737_22860 [Ferruginibacter sp.]